MLMHLTLKMKSRWPLGTRLAIFFPSPRISIQNLPANFIIWQLTIDH